jgi:RNA 3'-terminal phosphate cyclase (ATP)
VLRDSLDIAADALHLRSERNALGPGNVVLVNARFGDHVSTFAAHGARGVTAEVVASRLAGDVQRFLATDAVIEEHLSDQLLLPLALSGGGAFTTTAPSEHLRSNAGLIEKFLPVEIAWQERTPGCWRVTVSP